MGALSAPSPEGVVLARLLAVDALCALTTRQELVVLCHAARFPTAETAQVVGDVGPRAVRAVRQWAQARALARLAG